MSLHRDITLPYAQLKLFFPSVLCAKPKSIVVVVVVLVVLVVLLVVLGSKRQATAAHF